jgi:hypothetical protein
MTKVQMVVSELNAFFMLKIIVLFNKLDTLPNFTS